jgi:antitoxin Phd
MDSWSVQEAKARFSEFLESSIKRGPQVVTKRGVETAILVPIGQWRRMQRGVRPSLKELLLSAEPRLEGGISVPGRGRSHRRVAPELE